MTDDAAKKTDCVLINASDAFPDLERLKQDFDMLYFLDLCTGLETAILYDELHCTAFGSGAAEILEPLVGPAYSTTHYRGLPTLCEQQNK